MMRAYAALKERADDGPDVSNEGDKWLRCGFHSSLVDVAWRSSVQTQLVSARAVGCREVHSTSCQSAQGCMLAGKEIEEGLT